MELIAWISGVSAVITLVLAIATVVMASQTKKLATATVDMASYTKKLAETASDQVKCMRNEVLRQAVPNIVVKEVTWPSFSAGEPRVGIHLVNAGPGEAYHIQSNGWVETPANESKPAHATKQHILLSAGDGDTMMLDFLAVAPESKSLEFMEYVDLYTLITWQDKTGRDWARAIYRRYQGDRQVPVSETAWPTEPHAQALEANDNLLTLQPSPAELLAEVKSQLE